MSTFKNLHCTRLIIIIILIHFISEHPRTLTGNTNAIRQQ